MSLGAIVLMAFIAWIFAWHLSHGMSINNEKELRNLYETDYLSENEEDYHPDLDKYYNYRTGNMFRRHFKDRKPVLSYGGAWGKRSTISNNYSSTFSSDFLILYPKVKFTV